MGIRVRVRVSKQPPAKPSISVPPEDPHDNHKLEKNSVAGLATIDEGTMLVTIPNATLLDRGTGH